MNDIWRMMASLLVGVLLGLLFFGGLWWTVNRGLSSSKWPGMLFAGSMLLRTVSAAAGFYVIVTYWGWRALLICLAGFVLARLYVTRAIRLPTAVSTPMAQGGDV